ncbi:hypothetical protein CDL15_Pgr005822 [Punica granatum]|nr:hypothetical protein CDL15_Pgr005822 [Punica granatum]
MLTGLLRAFDDEWFMKELLHTHAPDESAVMDVQSLFVLAENTLRGSTGIVDSVVNPNKGSPAAGASTGSTVLKPPKDGFKPPLSTISEIGCEITCKALDTEKVRETMKSVFHELSPYSWVSKAVLTLSAFALHYADFWRLAHVHTFDRVTESMAILKGLPAITKPLDQQKIQVFGVLNEMVKTTLDMTECIVDFEHESKDVPELSRVIDISVRVYQIIVTVLVCSVQFTALISAVDHYKGRDLPTFPRKVKEIHKAIKLDYECFKEKKEEIREYQRLQRLFNAPTVNVELIKSFFYIKDNPRPLSLGSKKVTVESLRRKNVLLLITDLKLSSDDHSTLINIYNEPKFKGSQYEILWVPVVHEPVAEEVPSQFKTLQAKMPWYSALSPNLINKIAIRIIKEKWHFRQESIVVVLDQQGLVVNPNAMYLIHLWGWDAFPFTESMGKTLWRDINWFELLVTDLFFPKISEAIKAKKYILLYGGEDTKELEDNVKKIKDDGVSIEAFNLEKAQLFGTRLESCMLLQLQTKADIHDSLMQDILKLYTSFKDGGFAVLSRGSRVVLNSSLVLVYKVLAQYDSWKEQVRLAGNTFDSVVVEHHNEIFKQPRCHHISIPNMVGYTPENVKCPNCSRMMKGIVNFECCHGDPSVEDLEINKSPE